MSGCNPYDGPGANNEPVADHTVLGTAKLCRLGGKVCEEVIAGAKEVGTQDKHEYDMACAFPDTAIP